MINKGNSADYQEYVDGWSSYFKGKQFEDLTSKPQLLIFFDNRMIDEFFIRSGLSGSNYLPVEIGKSPFALFKENIK
jgi:hypothetical protein